MTQNEMLKAIYDDIQGLKGDVRGLKDKVQGLEDRMQGLEDRMQGLEDRMQGLEGKVQGLEGKVQGLEGKVQGLEGNVRGLQLTLENETNRNIRIIAEGHLELNRKLDEALKAEKEKEMMQLRVNVLENDMRRVKEKVGIA